uniref:Uncharacterized protein n=1 Tax=Panagrolaimus davidi TaxID=227884 RepID=A0A914QVT1_9BILA
MSSNDSNIITNFDLPLLPKELPPSEIFDFNTLPHIIQERFFEFSSTPQAIILRQTCSYCSKLAKKYHGKYPTDKLEIRELQPGGPIHFNKFRFTPIKNQIEYIANPLFNTYEPKFLRKINIKKELAFTNVTLKVINEVMRVINCLNVSSLQIRCNITWKNLKKLKTEKITNCLFDGEIINGGTFIEFLELIKDIDCVL